MAGQPPSYYPDQQQQQGYSSGPQEDNSRGGGGPSDTAAGLAGMAMDFVGSGKGTSGDKGSKLVSEFFGK